MLLEGKTVLVTGGSAGIGQAIAIGAARQGADVAINFVGDDSKAQETLTHIKQTGRKALAVKGDVAIPETADRFIAEATDALGGVDVFVSNAGICPFHAFLDMPPETVDRTVQVNLLGAYYMVQAAARQMVSQKRGGSITVSYTHLTLPTILRV